MYLSSMVLYLLWVLFILFFVFLKLGQKKLCQDLKGERKTFIYALCVCSLIFFLKTDTEKHKTELFYFHLILQKWENSPSVIIRPFQVELLQ